MDTKFKVTREVEFSETDMGGIVHFTNFFRYMEIAEYALYRSRGLSVLMDASDPPMAFPRARVTCEYISPLRYGDLVVIEVQSVAIDKYRLTFDFILYKQQVSETTKVALGKIEAICVQKKPDGSWGVCVVPSQISAAIISGVGCA